MRFILQAGYYPDDDGNYFEGINYLGIWLIIIIVFLSWWFWKTFFKKKDQEFSDGCLHMIIIALILLGIYLWIRWLI